MTDAEYYNRNFAPQCSVNDMIERTKATKSADKSKETAEAFWKARYQQGNQSSVDALIRKARGEER